MQRIYVAITAYQSGFQQRIKIIHQYRSCNCFIVGQELHCGTTQIRSCHFGLTRLYIAYYTRTFKRLWSRPPSISIWMKLGLTRTLYECQFPQPTTTILQMGRWKSVPSSMKYQEQSTAVNDHIISIASNPTYFTAEDILLTRTLAATSPSSKHAVQKSTPTVRRFWAIRLSQSCASRGYHV